MDFHSTFKTEQDCKNSSIETVVCDIACTVAACKALETRTMEHAIYAIIKLIINSRTVHLCHFNGEFAMPIFSNDFMEKIKTGDKKTVEDLIEKERKLKNKSLSEFINQQNDDEAGLTLLALAADANNIEVVKFLVDSGANVNQTTRRGMTPLMRAAAAGWGQSDQDYSDIVAFLLTQGAQNNINIKDGFGFTALMRAAWNGNDRNVELLLNAGADPAIKGKTYLAEFELTALEIAKIEHQNNPDNSVIKRLETVTQPQDQQIPLQQPAPSNRAPTIPPIPRVVPSHGELYYNGKLTAMTEEIQKYKNRLIEIKKDHTEEHREKRIAIQEGRLLEGKNKAYALLREFVLDPSNRNDDGSLKDHNGLAQNLFSKLDDQPEQEENRVTLSSLVDKDASYFNTKISDFNTKISTLKNDLSNQVSFNPDVIKQQLDVIKQQLRQLRYEFKTAQYMQSSMNVPVEKKLGEGTNVNKIFTDLMKEANYLMKEANYLMKEANEALEKPNQKKPPDEPPDESPSYSP